MRCVFVSFLLSQPALLCGGGGGGLHFFSISVHGLCSNRARARRLAVCLPRSPQHVKQLFSRTGIRSCRGRAAVIQIWHSGLQLPDPSKRHPSPLNLIVESKSVILIKQLQGQFVMASASQPALPPFVDISSCSVCPDRRRHAALI